MATTAPRGDIGDLVLARAIRLAADRKAPMSERLARVHALCKQLAPSKRSHGALREFDLRALLAALSDNDVASS